MCTHVYLPCIPLLVYNGIQWWGVTLRYIVFFNIFVQNWPLHKNTRPGAKLFWRAAVSDPKQEQEGIQWPSNRISQLSILFISTPRSWFPGLAKRGPAPQLIISEKALPRHIWTQGWSHVRPLLCDLSLIHREGGWGRILVRFGESRRGVFSAACVMSFSKDLKSCKA